MSDKNNVNREYKDRLFKFIFGNPDNKEWTLSLYNAVNHSDYSNSDDVKLTTIDDVVYLSMKNDVSFLVTDTMNFYEQQSTFNPNLPMRFLSYAGMVYERFAEENPSYHKYSTKQQTAPTPKCVCFYNGAADKDDIVILKLSDSFKGDLTPDIEVYVTMININYGRNKELMQACKPLYEYSWFVENVKEYQKVSGNLSEAIDKTLNKMNDDWLIKPFLMINRAEVKHMCITEYDEEKTLAETMEDGIEIGIEIGLEKGMKQGMEQGMAQGMAQGMEQGVLKALVELVKDGILTLTDAAARAGMSVSDFEAKAGLNLG